MTRKAFMEMFNSNIKFKKLNLFKDRKVIDGVEHNSVFLKMKRIE
jgi:hypothetical protein